MRSNRNSNGTRKVAFIMPWAGCSPFGLPDLQYVESLFLFTVVPERATVLLSLLSSPISVGTIWLPSTHLNYWDNLAAD